MSLNDFTNTRIKDWLQIGATDIVVKNLTIVNSINIDPNIVLENVAVDNLYVFNDLVVKTDEGTFYNLKTPTNGNSGNVLQTDGLGNTFWGTGSSGGSGIIYNGILPIPAGQHITINSIGTEVFKSKLNESATNLDVDGLNITNSNNIYANQIRNISGNVLNFNTDDNITILNNQGLLTTKTLFTLNNELVSKEYVDNAISGSPTTATYQQIYNNSTPADTNLIVGKNIVFKDSLGNVIVGIIENGAKLSAPNIICDDIETSTTFSINDEFQKIENFGTSAPNTTNIQGNTITDELTTNLLVSKTFPATFVDLNNSGSVDVYGSDFTYNGFDVITTNTLPPSSNQTFQEVYDASSIPAIITMTDTKNINYTRNDNPILTLDSLNYKLTAQDMSVAQITSNNYFPPNSGGLNSWSLSPYNFTASASSVINPAHEPGTSFSYIATSSTDGWICANNNYDLITGVATTAASTLVNGLPVIGEWLQLLTSIAVPINGFYYGGLTDVSENNTAVDFQLVGSNDGVNFTLLSTQTAQTIIFPGKQYTTPTTIAYKYFRFIIQSIIPNNINGRCAIGSGTAFDIILTDPCKIRLLDNAVEIDGDFLTAPNFIKKSGLASQYLMADGSTTAISAIGSNIYLYTFNNATTTPPPNGRLRFDNNTLLSSVSNVYISHITSNNIDIDPFFISIQTNNILYIQHTTTSTEWIKFTITATPNITPEDFISIPVSLLGNGTFNPPSNIFPNTTNIYFSIFSSTETTNPFNQSLNTTDNVVFNTITKLGGTSNQYLMADGSTTPPINPTFQQVYNNSLPTPEVVMGDGTEIKYVDSVGNDILKIIAPGGPAVVSFISAGEIDVGGTIYSQISQSNSFIRNLGTSNQYLMADGSLTNTDNLNSVIAKTQYIDVSTPNTMYINATTFGVRSLIAVLDTLPFDLLPNASVVNITPPIATSSISLTTPITTNTQATTKLYVDTQVGAITLTNVGTGAPLINDTTNPSFSIRSIKSTAGNDRIDIAIGGVGGSEITLTNPSPATSTTITSTDNNLLTITGTSPTFSITPKYTYMLTFGGNNNGTTSQWLQYGTLRTATISNTNAPNFQAVVPIASTLVWASIIRTTTTGVCSLAFSINSGTAVILTPSLTAGQASNPAPYALNSVIPANGTLGVSVLSSVLSGNCLASFLLRSN